MSNVFLTSVAAHLYVRDVKASVDFFATRMGFGVDFVYGDPPFYGQVRRDAALLVMRQMGEEFFARDVREREELLAASITVASAREIEELFAEFQAGGVGFGQTLRDEPWGAKTFVVRDTDGNLILFAGPM